MSDQIYVARMTSSSGPRLSIPDNDVGVWLEYVYVGTPREILQSKTYIVASEPKSVKDCPVKSTNDYETKEKKDPCPELALRPVAMYRDPFRQGRHKIVLCELDYFDDRTLDGETRHKCRELLEQVKEEEPWFGFEQTYFFVDENDVPYDWNLVLKNPNLDTTDHYFDGKHTGRQRQMAELHVKACKYAGLEMVGMNREYSPSQWEYQLGPVCGIGAPDQLLVSRFILVKLAEMHGLVVNFFNLECMKGTFARSSLHVNFSTKKMRDEGGLQHIKAAIDNLSSYSQEDVLKYFDLAPGNNYKWRLCDGLPYMPSYDKLVCKVGCKYDSSVRIPTQVARDGGGYFEDRRPSGEADPYDVCRVVAATALLKSYTL